MRLQTRMCMWQLFIVVSISTLAACGWAGSGSNGDEETDLVEACEDGIANNNSCVELEEFDDGCDHVVDNENNASSGCLDAAFELYDCMREASCTTMWPLDGVSGCWNDYFDYTDLCEGELFGFGA